ncbi:HNH endonuclease [Deinococcus humi]|uniref:HNH endonuclease n=1 Tax=Deinococcus humi TaxID=662880 RepID=UPI003CC82FF3
MLETQGCRYCGLPNDGLGRGFQLDHVIPLSKGGAHDFGNIALCCEPCNRAKWNSTETEFLDWLRGAAQRLQTLSDT